MSLNFNGINIGGGSGTNSTRAVPDYSQGESLNLPAKPTSSTTGSYTCPNDGYIFIWIIQRADGGLIRFYVNGEDVMAYTDFTTGNCACNFIPVGKGDILTVETNVPGESWEIKEQKFYPFK